jgi:hypothetical protein
MQAALDYELLVAVMLELIISRFVSDGRIETETVDLCYLPYGSRRPLIPGLRVGVHLYGSWTRPPHWGNL